MNDTQLLNHTVASAFYGNFTSLRPAQKDIIRPIISGNNVVLSSGTGSGKTEAILAPIISLYWHETIETDSLSILYIAPTKALVNDLVKRIQLPLYKLGMRLGVRHGDKDDLASGVKPHLLITTPESLEVMLFRKEKTLKSVRVFIVDEVHLLYNTQRGLQLSVLFHRLKQITGKPIQWAALSATVGNLENVRDFLFGKNENAFFLQCASDRFIDAIIRRISSESDFLKIIKRLTKNRPTKLLVFANSRRECERLANILFHDKELEPFVVAHYSSLAPEIRLETEYKFSILNTAICIATSTLELGIDIGDINAVILWDVPPNAESFLQRIGRGNRRLKKTNAICLIPDTSQSPIYDALRFLSLIDASRKGELPIIEPYELYGAAGQQCLSMIAADNGQFKKVADLSKVFEHIDHLKRDSIEFILSELSNKKYLQKHGFKHQYGADDGLYDLIDFRMIYGNFGVGSSTIDIVYGDKILGSVPSINLFKIQTGTIVRFAGKSWSVRKKNPEAVYLEPTKGKILGKLNDFSYPGSSVRFDPFLCDRIWKIVHQGMLPTNIFDSHLYETLSIFLKKIHDSCKIDEIPFCYSDGKVFYLTFGGHLVNKAISLATRQLEYEANDVCLNTLSTVKWHTILDQPKEFEPIFKDLFEITDEQTIYQKLLPFEFQVREFLQEWLKDQTIPMILKRLSKSEVVNVDPNIFEPFKRKNSK